MVAMNADAHSPAMRITCESLSFSYGRRPALREVSFTLGTGVTGLLGPNGAGKSTLLAILATIQPPGGGTAAIGQHDLGAHAGRAGARTHIGYLPQKFDVMPRATAARNVAYAAWSSGIDPADCDAAALTALEKVGLEAKARHRASSLSGGQRQRLGVACAIAHQPQVLLLDEPTVGLDPVQRIQVRDHLHAIGESATVLVSTHIVEDLAQIASDLIVLDDGSTVFQGSVDELAAHAKGTTTHQSPIEAGYVALMARARAGAR